MPYSSASDPGLPKNVKALPTNKRKQWVHVFNSSISAGDDESTAFAKANGTVKKKALLTDWYEVDSRQLAHPDVEYNPMGGTTESACSGCHWFVSPDSCMIVTGDVAPNGVCKMFMMPPEYEPEPLLVKIAKEEDNLYTRLMEHIKSFFGSGAANDESASLKETNENPSDASDLRATPTLSPAVQSGIRLFKSADGKLRFFSVYSNNFQDRHKETITAEAHSEFVEWCTQKEAYPQLQIWHCGPLSKVGSVDWIDDCDGFVAVSGIVDKEYEDLVQNIAQESLGVSHGMYALTNKEGHIIKYRTFEVSILPSWAAANSYTNFNILSKEFEMPFTDAKKKWLIEKAGISEDVVKAWETDIEQTSSQLKQIGLEWKSNEVKEDDESIPSLAPEVNSLTTAVKDLTAVVVKMKEDITELSKSKDEMIKDVYTAAVAKLPQGFSATKSDGNVVEEEKNKSDFDWFGNVVLKEIGK